MSLEWTPGTVFQFLDLYKRHRVLWDPKNRGHRMADARREAWRAISEALGIDVTTIRKKYECLMATFRKLKRTAEENATPGATNREVYSSQNITWYGWNRMGFLLGQRDPDEVFVKSSTTPKPSSAQKPRLPIREVSPKSRVPIREVQPSSPEQEYDEEYLEYPNDDEEQILANDDPIDDSDDEVVIKVEPEVNKTPSRLVQLQRRREFRPAIRKVQSLKMPSIRPRRSEPMRIFPEKVANKVLSSRQSDSETKHHRDECDSFGEYVACSLRKHDQRTQSMIKQAINNILFEQEMKKYGNSQYTVVMSEDDNPLSLEQEQ